MFVVITNSKVNQIERVNCWLLSTITHDGGKKREIYASVRKKSHSSETLKVSFAVFDNMVMCAVRIAQLTFN